MPASKAFVEFVRSILKPKSDTADGPIPSEPPPVSSDKLRALPGVIVRSRGSSGPYASTFTASPASTSSERVMALPGVIFRKTK